nr:hypothetical protein [Tanacetum cinerariifolium]
MWSDQEKKIQKIDRLARSLLIQGLPNDIYSLIDSNKTTKDLWDALARHMLGSEYGEQDRKAANCGYSKDNCELNFKFLNNLQPEWKQYTIMMRQNKNLMDININALYYILKQNQGDVNDAMRLKKKTVVVTSDPLALIAEKTKLSKRKEKVVVSLDFKGSDDELKKITALLAKAFNQKKFYSKLTNNNLRKSSAFNSTNKKQEFVKSDDKKEEKQVEEKKRDMSKVKCYNCKKEGHFAKYCKKAKVKDYEYYKTKIDLNQEINANMIFMAQIKKVLSDSEASSSSSDDKIAEDKLYNGRKGIGFENRSYFCKEKDLRPTLYDERVINLGYTLMFLIHSNEALEIEKFKRARENKIEFAYDYGNLNESYVNENIKFSDDYFQEIINPDFDKIDFPFQQTSSLKSYVLTVILEKIIIDSEDEVVSLLAKEKENLETIESLKSKGFESSEKEISESKNQSKNDCQVVENVCDDLENSNVIALRMFKLNTQSAHACNNARNAYCNARMNDSVDVNDLFVFEDVSIRKSQVSKMIFRKKPSASLNVPSKSKLNKYLPRVVRKWLPKMKPLAEPVAKWILRIVQIYLWIIDSGCSKHMTGNRALLTNFVEKFLRTVRFGNNDFAVIAGYGDVVIGSMTIKRVYYVEGLENGVDLLTGDCSSNLYTIALNEIASNSSSCLLAKASSLQSWLWHQHLSHLNFATINNLVKNNLVR